MITKVFTQQNMARLAVVAGAAVIVLGAGAIKSNASVKQTANGDGSITISWDDVTSTDYSIGFADDIEGKYDTATRAKSMADSRQIVLPADAREYTITGVDPYKTYDIAVNYTYGDTNMARTATINDCYAALPAVRNLTQAKWWKYILSVDVSWDKIPGRVEYEVMFMDAKGKKIESKKVSGNSYSHAIKNEKIYTVKVRPIRKASTYNPTMPEETGAWSAAEYLFVQPTISSYSIDKKTGAMTITWKKVKGVSSYKVYVATKKKNDAKSYKKVGAVKANKNSVTIKGLGKKGKTKFDSKKTYYAYVLPYKKVKGKTIEKGAVYYSTLSGGRVNEGWI